MKNPSRFVLSLIALLLVACLTVSCGKEVEKKAETASSVLSVPAVSSQAPVSSAPVSQPVSSLPEESETEEKEKSEPAEKSEPQKKPAVNTTTVKGSGGTYPNYNTNLNIEDNVFMDALIYTGYNMEKHRADGNMWVYILSADKRGLGYLSGITYGGGSSGLETTAEGLPDIAVFERGGLVCASFATYVYFNYLPNVAGIDTSMLTRPERTYNAHSFYTAAKDWIQKGYARSIGFTASRTSYGYINFKEEEDIPIGSIIVFEDDRKHDGRGSHITVYGGYKNGHHWVYQVGTSNGPEMCAIERMLFGPDPQWPLMVITPTVLRMSAMVDITLQDETGAPIGGAAFTLKNTETGDMVDLGQTDADGKITKEGLSYGEYELIQTVPAGYICDAPTQSVTLSPQNNSQNTFVVTNTRE